MQRKGWQPLPFNQFILKVHGHCNLKCDHCYIYETGDRSWRTRPPSMTDDLVTTVIRRIAEHAAEFSVPSVQIVLHGGEPLLLGHRRLAQLAREAARVLSAVPRVSLGVQTNALLIDEEFLDIFDRWSIRVGVSLDGKRADHDRHRTYRHGGGSHTGAVAGLALLTRPATRHLFSGLLCTVDLASDPVETFEELASHAPPAVDFLLPHRHWTGPPPGRPPAASPTLDTRRAPGSHNAPGIPRTHDDPRAPGTHDDPGTSRTDYADWLLAIFDHWYDAPRRSTGVRLFEDIMGMLLGGRARSEAVGLTPSRSLVIETDGSLEGVDSLKSAYPGAARLGLNVRDHPLADALAHPAIVARQLGADALCATCLSCPVHRICGGGHIAHRYRAGQGFLNPSVYCADLLKVITHIHRRLRADLADL
ncbi:radical SAM protein [Streptomyces sp. NPDC055078]